MNSSVIKIVMMVLFFILVSPPLAADTTGVRAAYLRGGWVGAKNVAMGTSVEAITDDIYSIYWNPAGLSNLRFRKQNINEEVREKLKYGDIDSIREQDLRKFSDYTPKLFFQTGASASLLAADREAGFSGVAFNIYNVVFGAGVYGIRSTDIEGRDEEGNLTSPLDYYAGAGYLSVCVPTEFASVGVSVKGLYEDLDDTGYTGGAFDIGVQSDFIPLFRIGFVVQDLGVGMSPLSPQEGFTKDYEFGKPLFRANFALASRTSDIMLSFGFLRYLEDEEVMLKFGIGYYFSESSIIMLGVRDSLFSTGITMRLWEIDFAYALSFDNIDMGLNNTLSMTLML